MLQTIGDARLTLAKEPDDSFDAPGNTNILDYYLFPSIDVLSDHCRLSPDNGMVLDVYRAPNLTSLVNLTRPTLIPEAA